MNEDSSEGTFLKKSIEDAIKRISESDSKFLASQVIIYKSLGMNREFALACMQELARRKLAGDDFDYQSFISEELDKLPKIQNLSGFKGSFGIVSDSLQSLLANFKMKL